MGLVLLFLVGFGLAISGGVTMITYLNFLPAGFSWIDYFVFIQGRIECYFFPIGIIFMMIAYSKYPNDTC
ncbi:hypothetical protein NC797_17545 [Aquibacillus sp. 3ASR75-11]|uniref:Uncharacterized protein n=1 Tax=Terrihalobacillus insolitus TaxID=2950438 RepID=A0A9X3WZS4_9BACI|nr:hypothetical protein [Terrihalobacillus insolitus]MDC3413693.1 hypothetical protein [Terrihalobacillus insolitus]MDC3426289.1 hypothetical protein [Terrihalobacillus insolitus]